MTAPGLDIREEAEALARLRKEIVRRGWHRRATARVVMELLFNLSVAMAGIWIFIMSGDLLVRACAIVISTAGSIGVATNTHTSSHYATSNRRWVNELLTYLGYPVFVGLSACHWWYKHIVVHHPAPNVIGVDHDAEFEPWFQRTEQSLKRTAGWPRFYYEKLQWIVFPPALLLIGFNMQIAGWTTLIRSLGRAPSRTWKHWVDLAAMATHYLVWMAIPMMYFRPSHVLGLYALRIALMGLAMFAVLAPGHFPAEAVCLTAERKTGSYALLQTAATINFRTGWIGRMMCSGLEFQIEHHLFPNLSHVYYRELAPLVRQFCAEHGLPYRCYGWDRVLWKSLAVFHSPPAAQSDLEAYLAGPGASVSDNKVLN